MKLDCYDAVSVQGVDYVIVEKITYRDTLDSKYLNNPYKRKSYGDWHEFRLQPTKGDIRKWLTITEDDSYYGTLSESSINNRAPKGFQLHEEGTESVRAVWGDTDASIDDKADYKEYRREKDGTVEVFFEESWHGGKTMHSKGIRIPLSDVRPSKDAAAIKESRALQHKAFKKRVGNYFLFAFGIFMMGYVIFGDVDFSWHGIRAGFGVPYTIEEHMGDKSSQYVEIEANNNRKIYTSKWDPISTAIELIESVNGRNSISTEYMATNDPFIFIESYNKMYVIYSQDGLTHVAITASKTLTAEENKAFRNSSNTNILSRYAKMVYLKPLNGRLYLFGDGLSQQVDSSINRGF